MSLSQMLQILSVLPQFMENIKTMGSEEKRKFAEQLGLQKDEQEAAVRILDAFQEGRQLSPEEQETAQKLLEKGLQINNLDLAEVMQMLSGIK